MLMVMMMIISRFHMAPSSYKVALCLVYFAPPLLNTFTFIKGLFDAKGGI